MHTRFALRALAGLLPAALAAGPAAAVDRSWIGGSGDWTHAANWSPVGVPGTADKATLSTGTATLSASASVGSLFNDATIDLLAGSALRPTGGTSTGTFNIGVGALLEFRNGSSVLDNVTTTGAGTLQVSTDSVGADALVTINGGTLGASLLFSGSTINGSDHSFLAASSWTGGTFSGAARTSFMSDLSISGAATKTLLGGRILDLHGTTTWSGNTANNNNTIRFWNGGTLNNLGTFNDDNDFNSFVEHSGGGPHNFNNSGTYNKLKNTITTVNTFVAFNNSGTVNVNAGTLRPSGGSSTGTFNIAAGAVLDFRNGNSTLDNAVTAGAGTLMISSDGVGNDAVVTINGGTHTAKLVLSGSTLTGSDQVFQAAATWSGGQISGAARTSFMSDLSISAAATKTLLGSRIVDLHGTTTWSGNTANNNNVIRFWNGGTLNNLGTFNDDNNFDSFVEHNGGGPHNFNNQGTYNKLKNTVTTVNTFVAFNNSGTVNVNAGTLLLAGGTSTGSFNIAAGAKLEFRNGASTLDNATTSGQGTLQLSTDNVGGDAVLTINGGIHTSKVLISGSTLTGAAHTFQGPATWSGGAITGAASTTFDGDLAITGANTKTLSVGRVLNLNGTTTWSGNTAHNNNAIDFVNGATINNNGTFNDENSFNSFIAHNRGGPHSFNNAGTFNKQSDTTTLIENFVVFNNTGTVNVHAGTLQVTSALTNQGLVNVHAGATFLGSNATFANAGTLAGEGTVATHANGDVVNQGLITPGFGIGRLTVDGDLRQLAAGALHIELASLASFDRLAVTDDVTLAGSIVARNAGYVPVVGDSFIVLTFDQRLGNTTFDSVATLGYGIGVSFAAIYNPHDVTLVVVSVPEPQTYALLLAGLGLLSVQEVKRRRQAAA